jgi:hypothetical protein
LENLQAPEVLKLLITVDELKIRTLILYINEYLIQHKHKFLRQNPIEILETIYQVNQHDIFSDLYNYCLEEICAKPDVLRKPDKIFNLKTPLLELLLKRDDLLLDEIALWESLIKWCLAQHANISQDPTQWNNEEIATIERTVHRFIPLIRFYDISSADFITKVYPFRKIIPEDLISNILLFHMAPNEILNINIPPPRELKFDSVIFNKKNFAVISSWIKKKNNFYYSERNFSYNFILLYRASRDGYTNAAFHKKCDNKGATLVVIKIQNSEQIVGGYNPLCWDSSSGWKSTTNSFTFSFTNKDNLQSAKVGYSNGNAYSIYCNSSNGPVFGNGNDLNLYNGTWHSNAKANGSYPYIGIPANFKADDYEVFQVINYEREMCNVEIFCRILHTLFIVFVIYYYFL